MEIVERSLYEARVTDKVHTALCRRIETGLAAREGDTVSEDFAHDLLYSFRSLIQHGLEGYGKRPGRKFKPVDIETFVCASGYMDQRESVRPAIMDHLRALFAEDTYYYEACLAGNAKVLLADGTFPTIKELAETMPSEEEFWVYSEGDEGEFIAVRAKNPQCYGVRQIWRVEFTDGTHIETDGDHEFFTLSNSRIKVRELKAKDRLRSLYGRSGRMSKTGRNCAQYWEVSTQKGTLRKKDVTTRTIDGSRAIHRLVAKSFYGDIAGQTIHHINFNGQDNRPENLRPMDPREHALYHSKTGRRNIIKYNATVPAQIKSEWGRKKIIEYNKSTPFALRSARGKIYGARGSKVRWKKRGQRNAASLRMSRRNKEGNGRKAARAYWDSPKGFIERARLAQYKRFFNKNYHPHLRKDVTASDLLGVAPRSLVFKDLPRLLDCSTTKIYSLLTELGLSYEQFRDRHMPISKRQRRKVCSNHIVAKVERTERIEPVYCLTVPKWHSFFVQCQNALKNTINAIKSTNCFGGSIGSGKNYMADMALAYVLYDLSSYYSPQTEFGLAPGSDIIFMLQSKTVKLARRVVFGQFSSRLTLSPYFRAYFAPDPKVRTELRLPSNIIVMPVSSTDVAAIGMNIFGGIIDEMSYMEKIQRSKKAGHESQVYDQAEKLYTTVIRRMESRFMIMGRVPGKLFLLGAANHPQDFISRKMKEAQDQKDAGKPCPIFVMCLAQWESLPEDRFSGEKFRIELPSEQSAGRILPEGEEPSADAETRDVPVEYKKSFEDDFVGALKDIGGIPVGEKKKFIREVEKIQLCAQKFQDVMGPDQLFSVDLVEPHKYHTPLDIVNMDYIMEHLDSSTPVGIHIDLAKTEDLCGIAIGRVLAKVKREGKIPGVSTAKELPIFVIDGATAFAAPPNEEMDFTFIQNLILDLKDHINLVFANMDSYESGLMIQSFRKKRISSKVQSVDRSPDPYRDLKSSIIEGRLLLPKHDLLLSELRNLIRDPESGKIDHMEGFSKDISDCVAGVIHVYSRYRIGGRSVSGGRPSVGQRPSGARVKTTSVRKVRIGGLI